MNFLQTYKSEIILFCAAFIARLVALWIAVFYYGEQILHLSDSWGYIILAQNIASGRGFSLDGVAPFSFHVPGYPAYLALSFFLFNSLWPALFGQMFLSSLVPVLLFRLGKLVSVSETVIFFAGMFSALEPHLVLYSITYMTEPLYGFLFFASVFLFARFLRGEVLHDLLVSGFLLGISVYVRPVSQYVVAGYIITLGYHWMGRASLKKFFFGAGMMLLVFFVVVAPWYWRNEHYLGVWSLSSHGSYNLFVYDGASIIALRDGVSYEVGHADRIQSLERDTGLPEEKSNSVAYDRLMYERGLGFIKANLAVAAKLALVAVFGFWTAHNYAYFLTYFYRLIAQPQYLIPPTQMLFQGNLSGALRDIIHFAFSPYYLISIAGRLLWLAIGVASWFGVWKFWRAGDRLQKSFSLFTVFLFLYFSLIVFFVGLGIDGRMRYPIEPLVILFAAIVISQLRNWRYADWEKIKN